ncbi:hypothetical protein Hypma_007135 [Hypsizygus marmoreus]|uniref:Uncharacterized protein n=1 Tax=Hypsizygus marmoreus TaxID=39966 RepID=A0A369KBQ6_HYPMA|nr:hypothetical protein Hypma_007135 [Hypsizygus marmoreus]
MAYSISVQEIFAKTKLISMAGGISYVERDLSEVLTSVCLDLRPYQTRDGTEARGTKQGQKDTRFGNSPRDLHSV